MKQTKQVDHTKKYAEFRNYLLQRFNDYETPITMTAEQVRELIDQFYQDYIGEETYD